MATISKRGPYQWQAKIRRKGYPPQSKTFESKSEAEDWVNVIESEMVRGVFINRTEAEKTSFQQLIDRYLAEVLPRKKSQIPIKASLSIIGKALGEYRLANLTSSVIAKFRDQRLDNHRSVETVRKDLSVIHRVINIAIKEWGIAFPVGNPASLVKMPSRGMPRDRRLESKEEQQLMKHARAYGNHMDTIIELAMETAMRRSEIVNLRWEFINLKSKTLKIPNTKSGKPREIPLSNKALSALSRLPRHIDGSVFGVEPVTVTNAFKKICSRAEIADLNFHDLRHEATSRLFEKGLSIMEVALITGHETLEMLKRYTHLKPKDLVVKLN